MKVLLFTLETTLGLLCPKIGYETSIERKEDGFGIAFQIIIAGYDLPSMSSEMESLEILPLFSCSKIRKIPEFKGIMRSLSELHLDKTAIQKLPSSIERLTALTLLSLRDCQYLMCLPRNMDSLRSLEKLVVTGCSKLNHLPEHLWNIRCVELDLSGIAFRQLLDRNVSSSFQLKELLELKYGWKSLKLLDLSNCKFITQLPSLEKVAYFDKWLTLIEPSSIIGKLPMLETLYLKGYNEHMLDRLGLGSQNIMTTTNEHLLVKHGVHKTYMNAKDCYSLEPSQALHWQSSLSQTWSQRPQYNESSVGVTFTILNRYLQGLRFPKNGYETSIERKEDGFGIPFQIIIPGYEIPWWITHQRSGNSISIGLPPNWCNGKWMGFALCASLDASYSHISVEEFDLIGKTFGLKARVIARGDTPHSYYVTEISFNTELVARHIWLLHLSSDDWFATARSGEFNQINQIEVVFESSRPGLFMQKCGLTLVYKQDVEMFTQTICSRNRTIFEGCDGSHDEFDNLWRNCDDYNENEPSTICSSSEEMFYDRDSISIFNDPQDIFNDRNRGPRASKLRSKSGTEQGSSSVSQYVISTLGICLDSYNRLDFVTDYENAKFFIIKSFSEDNVHKSIKYNVWASTPHGNKKLDAAYHEAKEIKGYCPVFLLFSVNASGQFCGVAEMVGPVDFEKDADYWQQDRWSGQFSVRWHIIKDVPNIRFRHILLESNDNKPVTHSRDSQEVALKEGIEMLKIFKDYDTRTSILDDFEFYDERERVLRERKARQIASSTADVSDSPADEPVNQMSDSFAQALKLDERNNKEVPATEQGGSSRSDAPLSLSHDSVNQTSDSLSDSFNRVVRLEESNNEVLASEKGGGHKN